MSDAASRLALLEQHVQRAIELIGTLRDQNARLTAERAALGRRVEGLGHELEALREREQVLGRIETEYRRLVEERQELLGHVEAMLTELVRIESE